MRGRNNRKVRSALALLLVLIMGITSAMPAFADDGLPADSGSTGIEQQDQSAATDAEDVQTDQDGTDPAAGEDPEPEESAEPEEEPVVHQTADSLALDGYNVKFSQPVISDEFLGSDCFTDTLKATGKASSIVLNWSAPSNTDGITGYILLRKSGNTWKQIAMPGKSAKSYTDKTAKNKNTHYQYALLCYYQDDHGIKVSNVSSWAGAVTTKSKKKNLYSVKIQTPAKTSAVKIGGKVKLSLKFGAKPYSKSIRWTSADKSIATVNSKGEIKGIARGKTTITGRTHTGRIIKTEITVFKPGTAEAMVDVMASWMGYSRSNGKHKGIINIYNSVRPLPIGYRMRYGDAWCAAAVSAASIVTGNTQRTGRHCNVISFVSIFKKKGIWHAGRKYVPKPGDLIVYDWYPGKYKNNASHIGIVESVDLDKKTITTIEGNKSNKVARRTIKIGWKYIKGYGTPKYAK